MSSGCPVTTADLYASCCISAPQLSPDGGRMACVLAWIDRETDAYRSTVRVDAADGAVTRNARRPRAPARAWRAVLAVGVSGSRALGAV